MRQFLYGLISGFIIATLFGFAMLFYSDNVASLLAREDTIFTGAGGTSEGYMPGLASSFGTVSNTSYAMLFNEYGEVLWEGDCWGHENFDDYRDIVGERSGFLLQRNLYIGRFTHDSTEWIATWLNKGLSHRLIVISDDEVLDVRTATNGIESGPYFHSFSDTNGQPYRLRFGWEEPFGEFHLFTLDTKTGDIYLEREQFWSESMEAGWRSGKEGDNSQLTNRTMTVPSD
jgi:hypothetical protein